MSSESTTMSKVFVMWLFPLFSILTICSSLRFTNQSFGIGEVGVIAMLVFFAINNVKKIFFVLVNYFPIFLFILCYLLTVVVATTISQQKGIVSVGWRHDILAFLFLSVYIVLFFLVVDYLGDDYFIIRNFIFYAVLLGFISFIVNVFQINGFQDLSLQLNINRWHEGVRVSGWSADPNQWAFMLLIALFFIFKINFIKHTNNTYFLIALVFWFCFLPRSDAALLTMFFLVFSLIFLSWINNFLLKEHVLGMCILVVLFLLFKFFFSDYVVNKSQVILGIGVGGDKVEVRFNLVINALKAWLTSPIIGLGAGAYSGIDVPFQEHEAHNLVVQLLVNSGLIGFLAALGLFSWLFIQLRKDYKGQLMLLGIIMLVFHGGAQYMMRHPLFWMMVSLAVWEAKNKQLTSKGV